MAMIERRRPRPHRQGDGQRHSGNEGENSVGGVGGTHDTGGVGSDGAYVVGYGKPPLHSQFVPGQSGNPKGRHKGTRNLTTDVKRTLATPVKVRVGDRMRTRSTQEAALMILREKALHGNERALDKLLQLAAAHNNEELEAASAQPLGEDDQAILAAYVASSTAQPPAQTGRWPPGNVPPDE